MLKSITLNNFKKHKHLEITFDDGVSCVRGQNAVGKSTILKGIAFALFGASAAGSKDHLKTWGSKEPMSVQLVLDLPDYPNATVYRSEKVARVYITHDGDEGTLLASGQTPVTAFLEEQLGLNAKDLRTLMISPQGETQGLLDMGAAALEKRVSEIAKSHVIDKVLNLISVDVARIDGELEGIGIIQDIPILEKGLADLSADEEKTEVYIGHLSADLAVFTKDIAKYEREQRLAIKLQGQHSLLRQRVGQLSDLIFSAENEIGRTEIALQEQGQQLTQSDADALEVRIRQQDAEADAAKQVYMEFKAAGTKLSKTQGWLEENEPLLPASLASEEEAVKAEAHLAACKEQLNEAKIAFGEQLLVVRALETAVESSVCPECGREYEPGAKEAAEAKLIVERERATGKEEVKTAAAIVVRRAEEAVLAARKAIVYGLKEKVEQAQKDVVDLKEELERLTEKGDPAARVEHERQKLDELRKGLTQVVARLTKQAGLRSRLQQLTADLAEYKEGLEEVELDLANLPPVPDLAALEATIAENKAGQLETADDLEEAKDNLRSLKTRIEVTKGYIEQAKQATERRAELEARVANIKELQTYLRKNRGRLMADTWDALLNYTSALVSSVTEGRLSGLSRTNGDFMIKEDDHEIPCEELSGGQKSIVGICLRLALSQVFYGKGLTLLLDEPAADLADDMAAALSGMLRGLGHQVVMVTHRQGDASVADEVIEIGG